MYRETIPIAKELRNKYFDNHMIIRDTFKTLEQLGYLVIRFPAKNNNTDLSGFYVTKGSIRCIYINTNMNLGRQFFSAWHEFYHAETGDGFGLSYLSQEEINPAEYRANIAAGYILMPDELVYQYLKDNYIKFPYISYIQLIKMQNYFRVGYSALLTRLIQLYPEQKGVLSQRFALSNNACIEKMKEKVEEAAGDIMLVKPTKDVYLPESFFEDLKDNMDQNRVAKTKVYDILCMIEGLHNGD